MDGLLLLRCTQMLLACAWTLLVFADVLPAHLLHRFLSLAIFGCRRQRSGTVCRVLSLPPLCCLCYPPSLFTMLPGRRWRLRGHNAGGQALCARGTYTRIHHQPATTLSSFSAALPCAVGETDAHGSAVFLLRLYFLAAAMAVCLH